MQPDSAPAPAKKQRPPPKPKPSVSGSSTPSSSTCKSDNKKTFETLDLRSPLSDLAHLKSQKHQLDALLKLLRKKKKIVVIAGAGISVRAGIPDFRSAAGLFSTLRSDMKLKTSGKELFDAAVYRDDKLTSSFHDLVRNLHSMTAKAKPTEFHHLLATLAKEERLLRLYSQNVDCIDTQLEPLRTSVPLDTKGPWPRTIQLHGGLENMVCSKCGWLGQFDAARFRGSEPPDCQECKEMESVRGIVGKRSLGIGKLRPRIVLYNEFNPDADAIGAVTSADLKARPDALLVVGTSLKIPGVKRIVREMCGVVQDYRGGLTVWINEDDPPSGREFEGAFDLVVRGDCEKVAKLANMPRWDGSEPPQEVDAPDSDSGVSISSEHEPTRTMCRVEVQVPQTKSTAHGKGNNKKRAAPDTKEKIAKKAKTTSKSKRAAENPQRKNTGLKKFITKVKKAVPAMKKETKPKNAHTVIPKLAAISISTPVPATPTSYVPQVPPQSTIYIPSPSSSSSLSSGLSSPMDIKSLLNP